MKKLLAMLALLANAPVFAQSQPASEASIRELMTLNNSKALVEQVYGQLDGLMEKAMNDARGGKVGNPEQEKLLAEMRAKLVALLREDMSWEKLEPVYLKVYCESLSQAEVDGINAFYKSEAGQAVIAKMPQLTQSLMQIVMEQMQAVTPKIQALEVEYKDKLSAAAKQ